MRRVCRPPFLHLMAAALLAINLWSLAASVRFLARPLSSAFASSSAPAAAIPSLAGAGSGGGDARLLASSSPTIIPDPAAAGLLLAGFGLVMLGQQRKDMA